MAKAQVTTPSGIKVHIDGTPEEILRVVDDLEKRESGTGSRARTKKATKRLTLPRLIATLAEEGFFKKPRSLADIRAELETHGHHYPVTTLSGAALTEVRKRNLRRLKREGQWYYTR